MTHYKYTCFDSRALNETRLIFAFAGVKFEEDLFTRNTWEEEKSNYPWGQLPVLEEDGKFLSQSKAIVRYLGNKFNLAGEDAFQSAKCDEMLEAMGDLQKPFFTAYHEKDEGKKAELFTTFNETFTRYLTRWDKILAENKGFLVGNRISYADIYIASYLQVINDLQGGKMLDKFPNVVAHGLTVFESPGIKEFVASRPKTQF